VLVTALVLLILAIAADLWLVLLYPVLAASPGFTMAGACYSLGFTNTSNCCWPLASFTNASTCCDFGFTMDSTCSGLGFTMASTYYNLVLLAPELSKSLG
jgi:hypothetical protein